ncbi:MAG TPA: response regulator, partial [Gemmatimonadaceae bacterium]|nr:response regulator [Gemmatimonadaceae bacterium]
MRGPDSKTVVVVEDDASMSQAMERILRLGGLAPVTFASAEEASGSHAVETAACLIIDLQLPGLNGFALRDRLAAAGVLAPVIFISAFDEPEARAQALAAGAQFLTKPFSGRALLDAIRKS